MMRVPKGAKILEQRDGVALVGLPSHPGKKYPLWDIDALQRDVDMAERNIETFRQHIDEQKRLIAERKEQIKLCQERDQAIAEWERDRADSDFPSGNEDHQGSSA